MTSYFILLALIPASALIMEDVFPPRLEECFLEKADKNITQYDVQKSCLESFLEHMYNNKSSIGLRTDAFDWLDSLGRKLHNRLRRQTRYRLRVRKEIRTLSENEFQNFIDAVKALKSDTSVSPNKYDSFALMHQGKSAHDGPNFVSWHRYYCVLFEEALREYNSEVTLPYWDSRPDYLMDNQEDSILFTEIFLGNPKGVVYTGPFAYWSTPTKPSTLLRRELGIKGSPINPDRLKSVFRKRYHREILRPTAPNSDHANLESHHDSVHRWVGGNTGHMADITLSPMDPIFWLHHCFIDYLWEKFRECQTKLGINSETDYPPTTILEHMPNRRMDNLRPQKTNIQGFSNSFTKQIYRYAPAPTCRNNCGGAFNGFLFCDIRKQACVSRSRYEFIGLRGFRTVHNWYPSKEKGKRVTIPRFFRNLNQLLDQQAISSLIKIGGRQEWVSHIGGGHGVASHIGDGMGATTQIKGGYGDASHIGDGMGVSTQIGGGYGDATHIGDGLGASTQIGGGHGDASHIGDGIGASTQIEGGYGDASHIGDGMGASTQIGGGHGDASLKGDGMGASTQLEGGYGDASHIGDGMGASTQIGGGHGDASHIGDGCRASTQIEGGYGDASHKGDGMGASTQIGGGHGDASPIGDGMGASTQIGGGYGDATQIGDGMGTSTQIGGGHGDASQIGDGMGASTQIEGGYGDASNIGDGLGASTQIGGGHGDAATQIGDGMGASTQIEGGYVDASPIGDGLGASTQIGGGHGDASHIGDGMGASTQIGGGHGDASHIGDGMGASTQIEGGYGDASPIGDGLGASTQIGGGHGDASHIGDGMGASTQIGGGYGDATQIGDGMGTSTQLGGGYGDASHIGDGLGVSTQIGGGYGDASHIGDGMGASTQIGGGHGDASHIEDGIGDVTQIGGRQRGALWIGGGIEDVTQIGDGMGASTQIGGGQEWVSQIGGGHGDTSQTEGRQRSASWMGGGLGASTQVGGGHGDTSQTKGRHRNASWIGGRLGASTQIRGGHGDASQIGDGMGASTQIGGGHGDASQIGDGMGASTQIGGGHGDASQIGDGMGASTQIGSVHGDASQIGDGMGASTQIGGVHGDASQIEGSHRGALQIGGGFGAASHIEQALGSLPDISAFGAKENSQLTRNSIAPTITRRFSSHFDNPGKRGRRSVDFSLTGNNVKIGFDISLRLKQEMRKFGSMSSIKYKFDNFAITPIIIINKHKRNRNSGQDEIINKRTFNITFQTDGCSYSGRHLDYISIDERTRSSESIALIVFKKPISGETKAYVRVYDSNGVMCQPSCLVSKSTYKGCSGLIKITPDCPRMYVDSYNDAFDSEITPFLRFVCVY